MLIRAPLAKEVNAMPPAVKRIMAGKTLADLFKLVEAEGWLINNLFQLTTRRWRCNLRFQMEDRNSRMIWYFHEFADADTPEEAMAHAIHAMQDSRGKVARREYKPSPGTALAVWDNQTVRALLQSELERWLLREVGALK